MTEDLGSAFFAGAFLAGAFLGVDFVVALGLLVVERLLVREVVAFFTGAAVRWA